MNGRSLIVFLFLVPIAVFSQDSLQNSPRYTVEWAPAGIFLGKLTVGGEYMFKPKNSVHVTVGIPLRKGHSLTYDGTESTLNSAFFSVLGGYRYYLGKKPNSGAYIEPYAKYLHYKGDGMLAGKLNGEDALYESNLDYSGFGLGAQLGAKFLIGNKLSLDFYFFGPEANTSKFNSSFHDVADNAPWTDADAQQAEQDVTDAIKDIPIVGKKAVIDVEQNAKTIWTSYSGFLPGFRFGLSFGFRF